MSAWVPVTKPAVDVFRTEPTADLVLRCGLSLCPGVRLTANRLAIQDSEGFYTEFYVGDGGLTYARVIDPRGFAQWLQELRVLPKESNAMDTKRSWHK